MLDAAGRDRVSGAAARGRRAGRRSDLVFHLAPAARLTDRGEAIHRLAGRLELPNPFFLPEFLGPAIGAFGHGAVELALVTDGRTGECLLFAPVGPGLGQTLFGAARVFAHSHGSLPTPLKAPEIETLAHAARRLGLPVLQSARQARPILGAGSPAFERLVKGRKRN